MVNFLDCIFELKKQATKRVAFSYKYTEYKKIV